MILCCLLAYNSTWLLLQAGSMHCRAAAAAHLLAAWKVTPPAAGAVTHNQQDRDVMPVPLCAKRDCQGHTMGLNQAVCNC
jgi:hypothetical protein